MCVGFGHHLNTVQQQLLLLKAVGQTGPHIFNRVHTKLPDWQENVSKLCSSLPLFVAQSTLGFTSNEKQESMRGLSSHLMCWFYCTFSVKVFLEQHPALCTEKMWRMHDTNLCWEGSVNIRFMSQNGNDLQGLQTVFDEGITEIVI